MHHSVSSGGANWVSVSDVRSEPVASFVSYVMPVTPRRPLDTRFDPREGPGVPAWWTPSGHLLVRPIVNGQQTGFMVLDTGGSQPLLEAGSPNQCLQIFNRKILCLCASQQRGRGHEFLACRYHYARGDHVGRSCCGCP
jgi:hypothetical protein